LATRQHVTGIDIKACISRQTENKAKRVALQKLRNQQLIELMLSTKHGANQVEICWQHLAAMPPYKSTHFTHLCKADCNVLVAK
jgi:hypothetical protein